MGSLIDRTTARVLMVVAVLLVTAGALLVSADPGPLPGDLAVVGWLQGLGEPVPRFANLVRDLTGTGAALIVGTPAAIWLLAQRDRHAAAAVAVALVAMLIVQPGLKELVDRPRPAAELVEIRGNYESKSYPSGHSLSTTTIWGAAVLVALQRRRNVLAVLAAIPVTLTLIASSVQGTHWPSDAVAGTLTGAVAAIVIADQTARIGRRRPRSLRRTDRSRHGRPS